MSDLNTHPRDLLQSNAYNSISDILCLLQKLNVGSGRFNTIEITEELCGHLDGLKGEIPCRDGDWSKMGICRIKTRKAIITFDHNGVGYSSPADEEHPYQSSLGWFTPTQKDVTAAGFGERNFQL